MTPKPIPKRVIEKVLARSGGNCEAMLPFVNCTMRGEHKHHRKISGREHLVENIIDSCHLCHEWIHQHPKQSYELGLLVKMSYDPGDVPIARRGRVVLLDNSGGFENK